MEDNIIEETIIFLGNKGTGKNSLCNCIFKKYIFNSGVSIGDGLTKEKQEYLYENKLYIDIPALDNNIESEIQNTSEI